MVTEKQIEAIAAVISPTCFGADADALLDRWANKPHNREAAERAEIKHGLGLGVRRKTAREKAAAIAALLASQSTPAPEVGELVERLAATRAALETAMGHFGDDMADAFIEFVQSRNGAAALSSGWRSGHVTIAHDGFAGDIIGQYTTREGKRGVVVQQDGTRVVHVYGEKWLEPTPQGEQG